VDPVPSLVAIGVLIVLALVMRWVFKPSHPRRGRPVNASDARELGLLSVVSTLSRPEATTAQTLLGEAGIRCSLSRRDDGQVDLLVFTGDENRARMLLRS
jgi:hypothetical protein